MRTIFALPLAAGLLTLTIGAAQAQTNSYLYVGTDSGQLTRGAGTATVSATGTTASGTFAFINADASTTNYKGVSAFGTGQITITGGTFQQILASDSGVVNLIGNNLTQSETFQIDPFGQPWYTVSGTLQQSQTPFTAQWYAPSTGTLEFNGAPAVPGGAPVPEASSVVSLGLLLVGMAWIVVKRRKIATA